MNGVDDSPWSSMLGCNVSHLSGPLPTLHRLKLIEQAGSASGTRKALVLGKQRKLLRSGVQATTQATDKVANWVRAAEEAFGILIRAPATCTEWLATSVKLVAALKRNMLLAGRQHGDRRAICFSGLAVRSFWPR